MSYKRSTINGKAGVPVAPKDHHEIRSRGHEIEGSSDRSFGFVMAGFLVLLCAVNWWHSGRVWPLYLMAAAVLLAVVQWWPAWLAPFNRVWTKIGFLLAKVVNPIVMGVIFFVVITPIAVLARLRGRDLLQVRADRAARSYWIVRDPSQAGSMKDQF